jgi:hypothetical protein
MAPRSGPGNSDDEHFAQPDACGGSWGSGARRRVRVVGCRCDGRRRRTALPDEADPKHPPRGEYGGAPQSCWLSLHDYHQVAVAKSLHLPMLILQGDRDFQVSPELDFDAWKHALAGKRNVTFHLYRGLSHLFMPAPTKTLADYERAAHVDPQVISDIARWIEAQPVK